MMNEMKNLHMDHCDDMLFLYGTNGLRDAIRFLRVVRDMLQGESDYPYSMTVKFDGAPAILCGENPENGRFFVATKSLFNKTPKINYTEEDIDQNHPAPEDLNRKLKIALRCLPSLGIHGKILQGDLMFTQFDLRKEIIDGESYITFQPNTITYAVPAETSLAKTILMANLGIVFHTTYRGDSIDSLSASFGANILDLNKTSSVWFDDATFKDLSGTASLTKNETEMVTMILSKIGKKFRQLDAKFWNDISSEKGNKDLRQFILTFINKNIRNGVPVNPKNAASDLMQHIEERYRSEINKVKQERTKSNKRIEMRTKLRILERHREQIQLAFEIHSDLAAAKRMLLQCLEKIESMTKTFIRDENGYRVTSHEGFVAISHLSGNAVKLVNRLEFSTMNFNTDLKNWRK